MLVNLKMVIYMVKALHISRCEEDMLVNIKMVKDMEKVQQHLQMDKYIGECKDGKSMVKVLSRLQMEQEYVGEYKDGKRMVKALHIS